MRDPFEPNWNDAPDWAQWHTVDEDGDGEWWELPPIVEVWTDTYDNGGEFQRATWDRHEPLDSCEWQRNFDCLPGIDVVRLLNLDWRNSLRHRPVALLP